MSTFVKLEIPYISLPKQKRLLPTVFKWKYAGHFSQHSKNWIIYFEEAHFLKEEITSFLEKENVPYEYSVQKFQLDPDLNWNGMYQPVLISDYCFVRTPIHPKNEYNCQHEITITPALSFGMGHHATTKLMLKYMQTLDFENKVVLDAGTGTGILGIIALKEKAREVIAIDIDPYSAKNATANAKRNGVAIIAKHATIIDLEESCKADYILANIAAPVHLSNVKDYYFHLSPGGILTLSGVLDTDLEEIKNAYEPNGFKLIKVMEEAGWLLVVFERIM